MSLSEKQRALSSSDSKLLFLTRCRHISTRAADIWRDFLVLISQMGVRPSGRRKLTFVGEEVCDYGGPALAGKTGPKTTRPPPPLVITQRRTTYVVSVISTHLLVHFILGFSLWSPRALFSGIVRQHTHTKTLKTACVQRDITLLKAKQTCVCACPVISLLTCALTVGIWDPGNDGGR